MLMPLQIKHSINLFYLNFFCFLSNFAVIATYSWKSNVYIEMMEWRLLENRPIQEGAEYKKNYKQLNKTIFHQ